MRITEDQINEMNASFICVMMSKPKKSATADWNISFDKMQEIINLLKKFSNMPIKSKKVEDDEFWASYLDITNEPFTYEQTENAMCGLIKGVLEIIELSNNGSCELIKKSPYDIGQKVYVSIPEKIDSLESALNHVKECTTTDESNSETNSTVLSMKLN